MIDARSDAVILRPEIHSGAVGMDLETEPNIVSSGKACKLVHDGVSFSIEIYRLESNPNWALEVVDDEGTSQVWDDEFSSDNEALEAALTALKDEGAAGFVCGNNIVPFSNR